MPQTYDLIIETPRTRRGNIVFYLIARLFFLISGWRVTGKLPANRKLVAIGGPHTSNFDGVLMLMLSWRYYLRLDWMVKSELGNHWLLGSFARAFGGLPINRSASFNAVDQAASLFETHDDLWLTIAPEGTRRKTDHWKTGFYWIAHKARVPILVAYVQYTEKRVHFVEELIWPTGDIDADLKKIWAYWEEAVAAHPEKVSDMRIRPAAARKPDSIAE